MLKAEVPEKSEDRGQKSEMEETGRSDLGLSVLNLGVAAWVRDELAVMVRFFRPARARCAMRAATSDFNPMFNARIRPRSTHSETLS